MLHKFKIRTFEFVVNPCHKLSREIFEMRFHYFICFRCTPAVVVTFHAKMLLPGYGVEWRGPTRFGASDLRAQNDPLIAIFTVNFDFASKQSISL